MKVKYKGIELELEKLPNGKYKKPDIAQFTKSGRGVVYFDDCRIPYENKGDFKIGHHNKHLNVGNEKSGCFGGHKGFGLLNANINKGRFPANLLVSNNVLNDGRIRKSNWADTDKPNNPESVVNNFGAGNVTGKHYNDSGSFSRYFDLDAWWNEKIKQLPKSIQKTYPFMIVPKANKSEKNRGCEELEEKSIANPYYENLPDLRMKHKQNRIPNKNYHPTTKPVKLMSYLIILGSREGDIVLDPFVGSGTTAVACVPLKRKYIAIDNDKGYCKIANKRINRIKRKEEMKLF